MDLRLHPSVAALRNTELIPRRFRVEDKEVAYQSQELQKIQRYSTGYPSFCVFLKVAVFVHERTSSARQRPKQKRASTVGGYIPDVNQLEWSYMVDNQSLDANLPNRPE